MPIRGGGVRTAAEGVATAARALPACLSLLRRHRPAAVFSIGGYAAGPLALAARLLGIPVALMEPNAEIGLSNRLVAPLVSRAYTAFPRSARYFRRSIVLETGVPLRKGFFAVPYARQTGHLRVLIFGGSQGAQTLNQAVPRALRQLGISLSIVHQCGARDEARTRALYSELGMTDAARVVPFIDDMHRAIAETDLVIGRAGAGTVGEICAVGRPSLLIPYPYAGDHQRFNAYPLVEGGAAVCVLSAEATPERLARELEDLVNPPGRLETMAERARALGRPEAARVIAEDLSRLAGAALKSEAAPTAGSVEVG
ncbi:MAG TPA: UDP-N-acetylglucosamine--N-acetylmuramyl-(pentapeptide) pyrophosphoryl-undecaprenol N-acetylglucosamine transferase, partial [Polyangiaceae bacterium]